MISCTFAGGKRGESRKMQFDKIQHKSHDRKENLVLQMYTHGKKLGNTSCVMRVHFRLKFSFILKSF